MMFWMAYGSVDGNPQEMLPLGALLSTALSFRRLNTLLLNVRVTFSCVRCAAS
jgi:hypothetical protein